jgi:hypothetical protein
MKPAIEQLRDHYQSQLDLIFRISRAGLGYYEKVVEANTATARQLLAIPIPESSNQGNLAEALASGGKIAVAHWTASVSHGIEFQRQIFASLANK